jgi:hypothetical protein
LQLIAAKYPHDRDSKIGPPREGESSMSKCVNSSIAAMVAAISVGLLATAAGLGTSRPALAADDCLAGPNRPPAPGGHWYYHLDRSSDRKCWYLVEPGAQTPGLQAPGQTPMVQAPQPQLAPEPSPQPAPSTFGSFFSSLSAGFTPTATQPNTTGDARVVQPAPVDELRGGAPEPGRQSRIALASKQHRSVHLRPPPVEHAEERPAASLNQAEREALFEAFLRWRDRQTP